MHAKTWPACDLFCRGAFWYYALCVPWQRRVSYVDMYTHGRKGEIPYLPRFWLEV